MNTQMSSLPKGAFTSKEKIPSGYKKFSIAQFSPEQMELFKQLFGNLGPESFLSQLAGGDEDIFRQMEEPAIRQFNETLGGIGSRFSGMGMGGRKSSGFQNVTSSAAQDFASQLQSNRHNLQRQAISDLMGFSNQLLGQRPFETGLTQKEPSNFEKYLNWAGQNAQRALSSSPGGF